jgi:hypothetical protein
MNSADGADYVAGGDGDDFLFGGYDNRVDTLVGGEGADDIYGRFYKRVRVASFNDRGTLNWNLDRYFNSRTGRWESIYRNTTVETELTPDFTPSEGDRIIGYRVK